MASTTFDLSSNIQHRKSPLGINPIDGRPAATGFIVSRIESGIVKTANVAAIVGPIAFLTTTLILESVQFGYNRIQDTVSALVWGQGGWCQTAVFCVLAAALASLALRFCFMKINRKELKFGIVLIALMSLGFILVAIFPTRAPGVLLTVNALVHRYTAQTISALFPIACFFIAIGLKGKPDWYGIRTYTLVAGGIGAALVLAGFFVTITDTPWLGILERGILANGLIWAEIIGIYCLSPARRKLRDDRQVISYSRRSE